MQYCCSWPFFVFRLSHKQTLINTAKHIRSANVLLYCGIVNAFSGCRLLCEFTVARFTPVF